MINALIRTAIGLVFDVFMSALAMVILGMAHGTDVRVPAFGFWTCFLLVIVLQAPLRSMRFEEYLEDEFT